MTWSLLTPTPKPHVVATFKAKPIASTTTPHITINADMYPDIMDEILERADHNALLHLRSTSHTMQERVDTAYAQHIVISPSPAGYIITSPRAIVSSSPTSTSPTLTGTSEGRVPSFRPRDPDGWDYDHAPDSHLFEHTKCVDFMGRICVPPGAPLASALAHVPIVRLRPGRTTSAAGSGDLPVAIGVRPDTQVTFAAFGNEPGCDPGAQVGLIACDRRLVVSLICDASPGHAPYGQLEWFPHHVSLEEVVVIFTVIGGAPRPPVTNVAGGATTGSSSTSNATEDSSAAASLPANDIPPSSSDGPAAVDAPAADVANVTPATLTPPPTPPSPSPSVTRREPLGILQNLVSMIAVHGQRVKHTIVGLEALDPSWVGVEDQTDPDAPTATRPATLADVHAAIRSGIASFDVRNVLDATKHKQQVLANLTLLSREEYAHMVGQEQFELETEEQDGGE